MGSFARVPWQAFDGTVGYGALRVLGALCKYVDADGRCYPSLARLAALSGVARKNIGRAIGELTAAGFLSIEHRRDAAGDADSNLYTVIFDAPEDTGALSPEDTGALSPEDTGALSPEDTGALSPEALSSQVNIPGKHPRGASHPKRARAQGPPAVDREREFAAWWAEWPHKVARPAAAAAYARALARASPEELLAGARRYAATKPPDQKWANPASWLRDHRWLDEPAPVQAEILYPIDGGQHGSRKRRGAVASLYAGALAAAQGAAPPVDRGDGGAPLEPLLPQRGTGDGAPRPARRLA